MARTIDADEAQQQWPELLDLAKAGNEVVISQGNTPVARLTAIAPVASARRRRVAGIHAGAIRVSEDFDQPLSDEFWLGTT